MERLIVTNDSEIVIDYEISEDNYERTTVTGGWTSPRYGGVLSLRTFFFQESDDTGKPVFGTLSSADKAALRAAGDDPSKAFTSGIQYMGEGKGDYRLVAADSLPAHYEYDASGGAYDLVFYETAALAGDYVVDGFTVHGEVKYSYAGEGKGTFRIGKILPLPERNRLFTIGAAAAKGALFLDAEENVSVHDKNLFSTADEGDNTGQAMKFSGGLKDLRIPAAHLTLAGEFSSLSDRFTAPDKPRESYFYRDWGLENVPLVGREDIGGARIALAGTSAWNLGGSYLSLSRDQEALSASKADLAGSVGDMLTSGLSFKGFSSSAGSGRERRFAQGSGVLSFWHLVPQLTLETERYKAVAAGAPDTGRYYRQGVFSIAGRNIGAYRANLSYSRRLTDNIDSTRATWFRSTESDEINFDGGLSKGGRILDLLATHRVNRDVRFGETASYNLARFRGRDAWEQAGLAADVSYRVSSGQERTRQMTVVFVGVGQGDYDNQGNEVGQKRGDYMLLYIPGPDTEPARTVELSTQASAGAGVRGLSGNTGGGGILGMLRREVSLDHSFSVLEESRTTDLLGLYLLKPSLLQRNDLTIYGVNRLREECTLFNSSKIFKLRISYSREKEDDNRTESSSVGTFTRDVTTRIESAPWEALAITWEVGAGLRERGATGASGQNYRVETNSLSQILNYRFSPSTRLSVELGAERRADGVTSAKQISYAATPSLNSSIGERINIASFVKFTYTDVQSGQTQPLFFLEEGLREDWSAMGQYRFSRNVSFGLNYTGRREKGYQGEVGTIHDLKVESRAYF
jgi:hypothetical protein